MRLAGRQKSREVKFTDGMSSQRKPLSMQCEVIYDGQDAGEHLDLLSGSAPVNGASTLLKKHPKCFSVCLLFTHSHTPGIVQLQTEGASLSTTEAARGCGRLNILIRASFYTSSFVDRPECHSCLSHSVILSY